MAFRALGVQPHVVRAAVRLALGCSVPLILDEMLLKSRGDLNELKSCQWAIVTLIMTSEPILGQVLAPPL